jgi:hypothetical protein|tara:strand:- start:1074 stop:2072 length:999 start_codon:yes stop_codon:yes gene_type:complete
MALIAIREVLTGEFNEWTAETSGETKMCQKRIELEPGYKYRVKNVQVFDDKGGCIGANQEIDPLAISQLTYVTPYPIVLVNEPYGLTTGQRVVFTQSGPFAADNTVLYKQIEINQNGNLSPHQSMLAIEQQFPRPELEQLNSQRWYTPHMYLTVIQTWSGEGVNNSISKSFYIELEKTKCSRLEASIGQYKEMLEAQARLQTLTANFIDPVGSAAGRSFPTWKYGGIRSELMLNSLNVLRYFNNIASRDYQSMMSQGAFRQRFKFSIKMVGYDQPFGSDLGGTNTYPDWINLINVSGVSSGPIRSFPPPMKFTGNGNTVMYDAAGNPASVVT